MLDELLEKCQKTPHDYLHEFLMDPLEQFLNELLE